MGIHDIPVTTIDGRAETLGAYRGRVLLIVNVASQCGFTPQYRGLEELHERFAGRGFAVLGFPCNQFANQEPGDEAGIREFCSTKFAVTFPMFAKVKVNGPDAHPLYRHLKAARPGLLGTSAVKWNFTKFLVNRDGEVVRRYGPFATPRRIAKDVEALLGEPAASATG